MAHEPILPDPQDPDSIPSLEGVPLPPPSEELHKEPPMPASRSRRKHAAVSSWRDHHQAYLDAFARYGVLSRDMLAAITGHSPLTIRTALHEMARAGQVEYHRLRGEFLYYPTPAGIALSQYSSVARSKKEAFGLAAHDLVVNTLVCNAIVASFPPKFGFVRWLGPREAREELCQMYGFEETDRSRQLQYTPDAYLEFYAEDDQGRRGNYPVVLEVDLDTETTARVVRKFEAGVRALALRRDGAEHNLLWVFVCPSSRFSRVVDAMHDRLLALRNDIPARQFPRVLVSYIPEDAWRLCSVPRRATDLATGESATWTGRPCEAVDLEDFVGVSIARDPITKSRVIRTQIPKLAETLRAQN
ncbi:replication-relaxation family protein [Alicyclobacillus fructus]|uniref:replication-relaxation family protein n=1 Tax=Alicyclobacillus fructus TaxID=2816082 RepID=UPI001A8F6F8B|nr:replication-relaxation family protein [Alicyclobacillus fructus]